MMRIDAGLGRSALREDAGGTNGSHTAANLQSDRLDLTIRGGCPGRRGRVVDQVGKIDVLLFETGRIDVGQIVGGVVDQQLLRAHTGSAGIEGF